MDIIENIFLLAQDILTQPLNVILLAVVLLLMGVLWWTVRQYTDLSSKTTDTFARGEGFSDETILGQATAITRLVEATAISAEAQQEIANAIKAFSSNTRRQADILRKVYQNTEHIPEQIPAIYDKVHELGRDVGALVDYVNRLEDEKEQGK